MKRIHLSALSLVFLFASSEALAVIGRPLTPMSYAGVARRTTRRAVYAGAGVAAATAVVGTTAAVATTAAVLSTLPAGCVEVVTAGVAYQRCGSTYYRPTYDGPNLVYVPSTP
ncbi:hypothetical protein [Archangium lansingense]|uniref:Uncharacterized protein n=1 Tax=Archangium lansingense TaxID=2995310 RepID=A0ABT4AKF8_9BACT|nr:hypothetical protein [Archangium lansinium]MCY1082186.1 hypothetical protein [Archangium lansinium]